MDPLETPPTGVKVSVAFLSRCCLEELNHYYTVLMELEEQSIIRLFWWNFSSKALLGFIHTHTSPIHMVPVSHKTTVGVTSKLRTNYIMTYDDLSEVSKKNILSTIIG